MQYLYPGYFARVPETSSRVPGEEVGQGISGK